MPSVKVWGGVSVLNALFNRRGSAMAVKLPMTVEVSPSDRWEGEEGLVRLESMVLRELGAKGPARVKVKSEIPPGVGLKSSSALTTGLALASMAALGRPPDPFLAVRISAKVSVEAGLSYTGAWDDAYASALAGLVVSDNRSGRLIARLEAPEDLTVAIYIIEGSRKAVDRTGFGALRGLADAVFKEIMEGRIYQAILENGILVASANGYGVEPIVELIRAGALTAGISGNGPAYFGLFGRGSSPPEIEGARRLITSPANDGFKVVEDEV